MAASPRSSVPHERLDQVRLWRRRRTYDSSRYTLETLLERKTVSVSVVLPARDVAETITGVLQTVMGLQAAGLIDELLVIDAGSRDGTAEKIRSLGVEAVPEADLLPGFGPSLGKGDALWRGIAHTKGDITAFFDTDTQNFGDHFVLGLLGPLLEDPSIELVKAAFHRPLQLGGTKVEDEGGRVTEMVARPMLNMYFPELAGFIQPLAGEVAARRSLLEGLAMPGGYGVEVAMLIDALQKVGIDALAEVDLGRREDANQPLRNLTAMAYAVSTAILKRSSTGGPRRGKLNGHAATEGMVLAWPDSVEWREVDTTERPPVRSIDR